jgi:hypothetical protein
VPHKTLILAASLALASPWTGAQTVWRCGSSYGQVPCEGGRALGVSEPAAGRPAAVPVARTDARLAAEMEKARLAQERNAPKAIVIGPVEAPPVAEARKDGTRAKAGKLEQFTAVSPGPAKEKPKKKSAKD